MADHHVLTGQVQSQAMSHAKFIFLIALVIFFVVLFVAAYVWMRRPDFGQKGGHPMPTESSSAGTIGRSAHLVPSETQPDAVQVGMDAPLVSEGP
ncbi:MAG: hypothetical protein WAL61_07635 [Acidimicrobiales bacterium]